jgi:hypothetical protein
MDATEAEEGTSIRMHDLDFDSEEGETQAILLPLRQKLRRRQRLKAITMPQRRRSPSVVEWLFRPWMMLFSPKKPDFASKRSGAQKFPTPSGALLSTRR